MRVSISVLIIQQYQFYLSIYLMSQIPQQNPIPNLTEVVQKLDNVIVNEAKQWQELKTINKKLEERVQFLQKANENLQLTNKDLRNRISELQKNSSKSEQIQQLQQTIKQLVATISTLKQENYKLVQNLKAFNEQDILPGDLQIRPTQATIYRSTQFFGDMSPFVEIQFLGQTLKSDVHQRGGKAPKWNNVLKAKFTKQYLLHVKLWDFESVKKDDLIGRKTFNLLDVITKSGDQWFELSYQGKTSAKVKMNVKYTKRKVE